MSVGWARVLERQRTVQVPDSDTAARLREAVNKATQALGVTYEEAMDQQLLPYAVVLMARTDEADPSKLKEIMRSEGAFSLTGDKVDLRFPTLEMAEAGHRRLAKKMPKGYWSITQTAASRILSTPPC